MKSSPNARHNRCSLVSAASCVNQEKLSELREGYCKQMSDANSLSQLLELHPDLDALTTETEKNELLGRLRLLPMTRSMMVASQEAKL